MNIKTFQYLKIVKFSAIQINDRSEFIVFSKCYDENVTVLISEKFEAFFCNQNFHHIPKFSKFIIY